MAHVQMTRHLYRYFPMLEDKAIQVPAGSVANILQAVEALAPGFTSYVLDERGAVRRHVNLCINDRIVIDRKTLSDQVPEDATLYVFQALSGG